MKHFVALMTAGLLLPVNSQSEACTTVSLVNADQRLLAKSYDWHIENAFAIANKKGQIKKSLVFSAEDRPVEWKSKYNSITFNQYGRELPNAGMNEEGLIVEVMVLDTSAYPSADERSVINETQVVQQALDTAATVDEALPVFTASRMKPVMVQLHYMVCDLTECAIIEYRDGTEKIYRQANAPYIALTNNDYDSSLEHLRSYTGFGGSRAIPARASGSLERFAIAASSAQTVQSNSRALSVDSAFQVLKRVESSGTQWQIVYDQVSRKVSFRTKSKQEVKTFDASPNSPLMQGNCKDTPVEVLPMVQTTGGDKTAQFRAYNADENASTIRRHLFGQVPLRVITAAVNYPSTVICE
jgi:penicillin V acylase-like amidase (Ntn superfamily)